MSDATALAALLPGLLEGPAPDAGGPEAAQAEGCDDAQAETSQGAARTSEHATPGDDADASEDKAWQERPLLIPAEVHRDMLARIERMSRRRVTESQRARERLVLASVEAAARHGQRTPADPVARKLARLHALAKAAHTTTGWIGVGHVLAVGVARMDQALDFAEVAEEHPKHFWPAFTALFRAHRAGNPKRNPAGWLRSASAAAAKNASSAQGQS